MSSRTEPGTRHWIMGFVWGGILLISGLAVFFAPVASGITWTQTTQADFLRGTGSNIEVLASGGLQLSSNNTWSKMGVVLDLGPPPSPDSAGTRAASVIKDGVVYRMWYTGSDGGRLRGLYATSSDGLIWARQGTTINVGILPENFDLIAGTSVMKEGSTYRMWFGGGFWGGGPFGELWARIYHATSTDGASWTIQGVVLDLGTAGSWDDHGLEFPSVTRDASGTYYMYYLGWTTGAVTRTGVATSTDGINFVRPIPRPVVDVGQAWEWDRLLTTSAAALPGAPWRIWYSGGDGTRNRIGLATSVDGITVSKSRSNPVLVEGAPGSLDAVGVGEPAILLDGTNLFLYHTMLDGVSMRIGLAREVRVFASSGWFESAILDSGGLGSVWRTLSANATVNLFSVVTLRTRSGDTAAPDASWSPWSAPISGGTSPISSPRGRYLQVRVEFSSASSSYTPVLDDFSVDYALNTVSVPVPLSPTGGAWVNASSPALRWTYADPETDLQAGFMVQVSDRLDFLSLVSDSGPVLSSASSWRPPALSDGGYYWRVQTMDAYGGWSGFSTAANVRVDTVPPTTQISFSVPPGIVGGVHQIDSSNRVVFTVSDAGSGQTTTTFSLNSGPQTAYTGPFLPAAHGAVLVSFRSTDAAGNTEPTVTVPLLVDDPPVAAQSLPPPGTWTRALPVTLAWTYSDPEGDLASAYEIQLTADSSFASIGYSSGVVVSPATSHPFPSVRDGAYYWRVRVSDSLGVWSPFTTPRTLSIDTVTPSASAVFGTPLGIVEGRTWIPDGTQVTITATDSGSGVARILYSLDGTQAQYSAPVVVSGHGAHTLEYWADDIAGNAGPHGTVEFLIDREPVASNQGPADTSWIATSPSLSWTVSDVDGDLSRGYEVQVAADAGFSTISASSGIVDSTGLGWRAPALAEGSYFWKVRAKDSFGVWSEWSQGTRFGVDTTAPVASARFGGTLVGSPVLVVHSGDAVELSATDVGSGVAEVTFSVDGGPWTTYSSPITVGTLGRHFLAFRAVDNAGNAGPTNVLIVDAIPAFNWTPVLSLVLAVIIALGGAIVARRQRKVRAGIAWGALAAPAMIVEIVIGVYSLATGELSIPPWGGAGLVSGIAVAVGGFLEIGIGSRILAASGDGPV